MINPKFLQKANEWKNKEIPKEKITDSRTASPYENDYWEIPNIKYRGRFQKGRLLKNLLDDGSIKTQDEWSEYSTKAQEKGEFYVGDMPLYHALFEAIVQQNGNSVAEEAKAFIKKSMEKELSSLTRIIYSNPLDFVYNNYNMKSEVITIGVKIVGFDEWIKDSPSSKYIETILKTKNASEVNTIWKEITGKDLFIGRINLMPEPQKDKCRIVGFGATSERAYIDCMADPSVVSPSLGVMMVEQK